MGDIAFQAVPEPATIGLVSLALGGLVLAMVGTHRRRRSAS